MDQHLTEEQLILSYYGESFPEPGIDAHLAACSACREEYRRLQLVLNSVESQVPERSPDYEARVWKKLAPSIARRRWGWLRYERWLPLTAMAGLILVAFLAGRYTQPLPGPQVVSMPQVRERILVVAVGDHLETSQMVLAEIVNLPDEDEVDFSTEKGLADTLVNANRLYRQTAVANGNTGMASVLDELEPVLVEIARGPDRLTGTELEALRQRIESQGLLFKIRVIGSQMRERGDKPMPQQNETRL
jgi:hypothetical protein